MQRFLILVVLSLLTIPVGLSLQGCANKNANYCNGSGYGYLKSQPVAIILQPQTTGLSVAFSQTSQLQSPTAQNCSGGSASIGTYTYGTTDRTLSLIHIYRVELRRIHDYVRGDPDAAISRRRRRRGNLRLEELLWRKLHRPVDDTILRRAGL